MIRENSAATGSARKFYWNYRTGARLAAVRLAPLGLASDRPQREQRASLARSTHALRRHSNCVAELQYNEASVSTFEVKPTCFLGDAGYKMLHALNEITGGVLTK